MKCYITLDQLIFLKYNFKKQVLREFTTTSIIWYNFKVSIDKSYQMFVFNQIIFSSTIEFIFKIKNYIYSFYSNELWINLYILTMFYHMNNIKWLKIKNQTLCTMYNACSYQLNGKLNSYHHIRFYFLNLYFNFFDLSMSIFY